MFRFLAGSISCALVLGVFSANANENRRASFDPLMAQSMQGFKGFYSSLHLAAIPAPTHLCAGPSW